MLPKRTSKRKEKAGSSLGTEHMKEPEGGLSRFLNPASHFLNTISHWATIPERPVKLDDFSNFEITTLVQHCGWKKVVEWPLSIYESLVREFYANFNFEIDTPRSKHLHQTWGEKKMDHALTRGYT